MKGVLPYLVLALTASGAPAFAQNEGTPSLASSPALAAICADAVTPHPKWRGFWHLDSPRFAATADALYATMHLKSNEQGEYAIVKVDRAEPNSYTEVARFKAPVRDLSFHDGQIWALLRDQVVALDQAAGVQTQGFKTADVNAADEEAHAFTWVNGKLVIAHGSLGTVSYDPAARSLSEPRGLSLTEGGQISKASDVTAVNDHQVAFAIEGVTVREDKSGAFDGIVLLDLSTGATERFAYDDKKDGALAQARIQAVGDQVIINNWGILHRATLSGMRKAGHVAPSWTPLRFDWEGVQEPGQLLGDLLVENNEIVACAETQHQDRSTGKVTHKGVVYSGKL